MIRLGGNGFDHFTKKIFRCIPQRHQDTDLHHSLKDLLPLLPCPFLIGKAFCSELFHGLMFNLLILYLGHNAFQISAVFQPVPLPDHKVHAFSQRSTGFPEGIVLDPAKLKGKFLIFGLQNRHALRQICGFDMLFFISFLIIHYHCLPFPPSMSFSFSSVTFIDCSCVCSTQLL